MLFADLIPALTQGCICKSTKKSKNKGTCKSRKTRSRTRGRGRGGCR